MSTSPTPDDDQEQTEEQREREAFIHEVSGKSVRKAHARRKNANTIWFGLGTLGMVGWSVILPALIGLLVGTWLDSRVSVGFSWELTLFFAGIVLGCLNAWYWISKEQKSIEEEEKQNGE